MPIRGLRTRRLGRFVGITTLVGAVALATACGLTGPDEPDISSFPPVRADTELVLPLDAYFVVAEDQLLIDRAFTILVRTCVAQYGLTWTRDLSDQGVTAPVKRHARRYGLIDAHDAATYGYQRPTGARRFYPGAATPPPAPHPSPKDAVDAVFSGAVPEYNGKAVPDGGCFADSQRRLDEGSPPFNAYGIIDSLMAEGSRRAEGDSRVEQAWKQWSDCMDGKGFDYEDPWEANDDPQWADPRNETREIATATADVACREQTNLVGIWYAVDVAYQHQLIEERQQELAALLGLIEAQKRNAARIISGG